MPKADSVMEVSAADRNTSVGERCHSSGLKTLGGTEDSRFDHQQSSLCRIDVTLAEGISLQHEVSARKHRRSSLVAGEECATRNEPLKIRIRARKTEQLTTEHRQPGPDAGLCTPTKLTRDQLIRAEE